jgi:ABC-type transport system involved in multi-copper enzyme maturation permease subunit
MKINFLILFLFISLANIFLSSTNYSPSPKILKKDEKITMNAGENVVIFDSDSFNEGDKISFKITTAEFDDEVIMFEFYDDYNSHVFQMDDDASPEKSKNAEEVYNSNEWVGTGTTNFYTIKKDKKYFKTNVKGKYLGIYIDAPGIILVENYKKEDNTVLAVIIVVVVVVIVVIVIIVYCIKRKKRQAETNNGYDQNNVNVNNNPYQGNYGPQRNNQNYNMNMNQRPDYNNNGYNNNNGFNNNPGYNNNGYNSNMGYNNNTPYANNPQQYSGVPQNSNTMRYG